MAQGRSSRSSQFVGLKMPPDLFRELRLLASLQGVSRSEVLRRGLRREIEAAVRDESHGSAGSDPGIPAAEREGWGRGRLCPDSSWLPGAFTPPPPASAW